MLFDVQLLRKQGLRLPRSQWEPPLRGTFQITEMDRDTNHFKRNILKVELWAAFGVSHMRGLATLIDPVLLPNKSEGLLIAGTEIHCTDGGRKIWEHRQVWLCQPAAGTEADWARATYHRTHPET
ncbi:hypothetical protein A9977_25035 [Variovorax sp. UMC13]|nr:hypothetical protein [Variovorax sp. UMC13]